MGILRWGTSALVSILALCALAACTAAPLPQPTPSSSPPAPTHEPTAPSFRLGLGCSDLAPSKSIETALHAPATPVDPHTWKGAIGLVDYAVSQAGGLQCQWAVDPSDYNKGIVSKDQPPAARLMVDLLPEAAAKWNPGFQGDAPATKTRKFGAVKAFASCGDPGCQVNALVGTTWVEILIYNPAAQMGKTPLGGPDEIFNGAAPAITSIFHALAAAGDPQPAWTPPASNRPIASTCTELLPARNLAFLTGAKAAHYLEVPAVSAAQVSQVGAAFDQSGELDCTAGYDATDNPGVVPLAISAIPGGAWILAEAKAHLPANADAKSVVLTGLSASDVALMSCIGAEENSCTLDFSIHGQAIEVRADQISVNDPVSPRELAMAAAGSIIKQQAR